MNEIVRSCFATFCTMKSSLRSDEIFGVSPQMKLNPPISPREAGFHREAISSATVDLFRRRRIWLKKALAHASASDWRQNSVFELYLAKYTKAMVIWPPSGREGDHRRWWKEPASIESNVFIKNGCAISRWLPQSRFARQLPPGGSSLFRRQVFFEKLYLYKITAAIFEIDFVSSLKHLLTQVLFSAKERLKGA